jgi:hypothetical protein
MNKTSSEWRPAETVKPNPTQAAPLGLHLPTQILLASHHLLPHHRHSHPTTCPASGSFTMIQNGLANGRSTCFSDSGPRQSP